MNLKQTATESSMSTADVQQSDKKSSFDQHKPLSVHEAREKAQNNNILFVDVRNADEIEKTGSIDGCLRVPFKELDDVFLDIEHPLMRGLIEGRKVVFFCSFGEKSTLALARIGSQHSNNCFQIESGMAVQDKFH